MNNFESGAAIPSSQRKIKLNANEFSQNIDHCMLPPVLGHMRLNSSSLDRPLLDKKVSTPIITQSPSVVEVELSPD